MNKALVIQVSLLFVVTAARADEVTFLATELLGRPTQNSVTVNVLCLETVEAYFEYGPEPGVYNAATLQKTYPGDIPIEVVLGPVAPNKRHYYRMRYRRVGGVVFETGTEYSFQTQRAWDEEFVFTVQSDSHLHADSGSPASLYSATLQNALVDEPDFHLDLGDTFLSLDATSYEEAYTLRLAQRPYFGLLCHSAPLFLVMGNHDGELGWLRDGTSDNLYTWCITARKQLYPNPVPDDFYSGSTDEAQYVGKQENYYSWEWGNSLFVVIDPFTHTTVYPKTKASCGSQDRWDWTLGETQYFWLRQTLQESDAVFKFVFSHHVTGGMTAYGHGGIEAASHVLGGEGSYEWGGENEDGTYGFDEKRPGWTFPIHQLMAMNGVTVFFHGHDHVFVKQDLDGIVYQACPQPSDITFGQGHYVEGGYVWGDKVNNSGHLRVTVSHDTVVIDYVMAYPPGDLVGVTHNGVVAYSFTIDVDCNNNGIIDYEEILAGSVVDCNDNRVPDECESDTDMDGMIDDCDPCPTRWPADVNGDGAADGADIGEFANVVLSDTSDPEKACAADIDLNGEVDERDIAPFVSCLLDHDAD